MLYNSLLKCWVHLEREMSLPPGESKRQAFTDFTLSIPSVQNVAFPPSASPLMNFAIRAIYYTITEHAPRDRWAEYGLCIGENPVFVPNMEYWGVPLCQYGSFFLHRKVETALAGLISYARGHRLSLSSNYSTYSDYCRELFSAGWAVRSFFQSCGLQFPGDIMQLNEKCPHIVVLILFLIWGKKCVEFLQVPTPQTTGECIQLLFTLPERKSPSWGELLKWSQCAFRIAEKQGADDPYGATSHWLDNNDRGKLAGLSLSLFPGVVDNLYQQLLDSPARSQDYWHVIDELYEFLRAVIFCLWVAGHEPPSLIQGMMAYDATALRDSVPSYHITVALYHYVQEFLRANFPAMGKSCRL